MGSGKSFLGKKIAQMLNIPFFDLDQEIEMFSKNSVENIFLDKGEDFFRDQESKVLKSLISFSPGIVSLGGGTPCFRDNIKYLNSVGVTIFIDTTPKLICSRLKKDKNSRPLIKDIKNNSVELTAFVEAKLSERMPFYQQAKFTVYQTNENQDYLINDIIDIINSLSLFVKN